LGYIREKKEKGCKRNKGRKSLCYKVRPIDRRGIGITVFQARVGGEESLHFMEKSNRRKILLDIRLLFQRE
jgi:hypothetical protein